MYQTLGKVNSEPSVAQILLSSSFSSCRLHHWTSEADSKPQQDRSWPLCCLVAITSGRFQWWRMSKKSSKHTSLASRVPMEKVFKLCLNCIKTSPNFALSILVRSMVWTAKGISTAPPPTAAPALFALVVLPHLSAPSCQPPHGCAMFKISIWGGCLLEIESYAFNII